MLLFKKILKALLILVAVLFVLVIGFTIFDVFTKKSNAEELCQKLRVEENADAILAYAAANDLPVFDERKSQNRIVVYNQKSPYGRFSCTATFKEGLLIDVKMAGAD